MKKITITNTRTQSYIKKKEGEKMIKTKKMSVKAQRERIVKDIREAAIEQIMQDELLRARCARDDQKKGQERFREEMKEVFGVDVGTGIDHLAFMFEDDSGEFILTLPRNFGGGRLEARSICGECGKERTSQPIYRKKEFHPILAGKHWNRHPCYPPQEGKPATIEQLVFNHWEETFDLIAGHKES